MHDLENRPVTRLGPRRSYPPRIAIAVAVAMLMAGCASSPDARPTEPTSKVDAGTTAPSPQPSSTIEGPFGQVGGWIAYSSSDGIWAVDPARPERRIRLGRPDGDPIAWSSDGTKLLIRRYPGRTAQLSVLEADGTETRLIDTDASLTGGSFSPDGSEVVYATSFSPEGSGIYVVDAEGGAPRLVRPAGERWVLDGGCPRYEGCVGGRRFLDTSLYRPTFSPDGTQIAYFDGLGDWGHSLWVMNADGTERRLLLDEELPGFGAGHMNALTWSPDGQWLAFTTDDGIYLVRPDGTGLRRVALDVLGVAPGVQWSPDGSRIAYFRVGETCFSPTGEDEDLICEAGALSIVNVDGGDERIIEGIRTPENAWIAWNPAV